MHAPTSAAPGSILRNMRQRQRLSQLELSLRVGVSQRHLSFIETGRGRPSREMLLALLQVMDAPLDERNGALLAAGFAPVFGARPLGHPDMAQVRDALSRLLAAHEPAPALVLDPEWNLLQANSGARALFGLLGCSLSVEAGAVNMLDAVFRAGGLRERLLNANEVCPVLWQSAQREASSNAGLRSRLDSLSPQVPAVLRGVPWSLNTAAPVMVSRFGSSLGELAFFSTFTTFGSPMDVTAASLRVEHLFAADERTRILLARCVGHDT